MPAGGGGGTGKRRRGYGGGGGGGRPLLTHGDLIHGLVTLHLRLGPVKMGGGSGLHVLAGQEFHLAKPGVGLDNCTQQHDDQGMLQEKPFIWQHLAKGLTPAHSNTVIKVCSQEKPFIWQHLT